jgi:hypothetical protein
MQNGFKIAAVILFSLAVVCALLCLILYFTWHVRRIHDDLTGKTAQRRIAELRKESGRWQTASRRSAAYPGSGPEWSIGQVNGLIDSDDFGGGLERGPLPVQGTEVHDEEDYGTTLLGDSGSSANFAEPHGGSDGVFLGGQGRDVDGGADSPTTLLRGSTDGSDLTVEESSETTLLTNDASKANEEELSTTLLGSRSTK